MIRELKACSAEIMVTSNMTHASKARSADTTMKFMIREFKARSAEIMVTNNMTHASKACSALIIRPLQTFLGATDLK
jgi:hypothetical protein